MYCRISPDQHRLNVEVTIQLPPSHEDRPKLEFALYSDMRIDHIELPRRNGPAERPKLVRAGEDLVWSSEFPGNTRWEIVPRVPFPREEPISLTLKYSGGGKTGFNLYIGPEGSFATKSLSYPSFGTGVTGTFAYVAPRGYTMKATGVRLQAGSESTFSFPVKSPSELTLAAAR